MFSLLWCYMHTFASLLDSLYHLIFSSSALSVNFFILFLYQKLWVHFFILCRYEIESFSTQRVFTIRALCLIQYLYHSSVPLINWYFCSSMTHPSFLPPLFFLAENTLTSPLPFQTRPTLLRPISGPSPFLTLLEHSLT